jgi:hypothetical protein
MKRAMTNGISGQDGAYLAKCMLSLGYTGDSRGMISIIIPVFNETEALVGVCHGARRELTRLGQNWESWANRCIKSRR